MGSSNNPATGRDKGRNWCPLGPNGRVAASLVGAVGLQGGIIGPFLMSLVPFAFLSLASGKKGENNVDIIEPFYHLNRGDT